MMILSDMDDDDHDHDVKPIVKMLSAEQSKKSKEILYLLLSWFQFKISV